MEVTQEELQKRNVEIESLKTTKITLDTSNKELSFKLESERLAKQQLENSLELLKKDLENSRAELMKSRNDTHIKEEEYAIKLADSERSWRKEKASLDMTIKELHDKIELHAREKLVAAGVSQEQITKLERELESKWKVLIASKETEITEKLQRESTELMEQQKNKLAAEAANQLKESRVTWEKEAFERGLLEGRGQQIGVASAPTSDVQELIKKVQAEADEKRSEVIKKIMNGVYFKLYEEFEEDEAYKGEVILSALMRTMKEITLKVLGGETPNKEEKKTEEEEEEEEEEEQEEDKKTEEKQEIMKPKEEKESTDIKQEDTEPAEEDKKAEDIKEVEEEQEEDKKTEEKQEIMKPKEEKESTDIKQEDTEPTEDKKEEKEPTEYHEATHTEEQGTLIDTEKVEQPDLFAPQKEESLSPKQEEDEAEQKSANETNQKEDSFAAFLSDNNL